MRVVQVALLHGEHDEGQGPRPIEVAVDLVYESHPGPPPPAPAATLILRNLKCFKVPDVSQGVQKCGSSQRRAWPPR